MNWTQLSIRAVASFGLLWGLAGCEGDAPQRPAPKPAPPATQVSAQEAANVAEMAQAQGRPAMPAGHPPIDPGMAAGMRPPEGESAKLVYDPPATWRKEPIPASSIRVDQYKLLRAAGAKEDAELAVTTNIGGGVEGNITRWRAQFTTAEGKPIPDEAFVRQEFESHGLKITMVDLAGTYAGAMMGMGATTGGNQENYRMLAAVVDAPGGLWFFKLTGPAATVAEHRDEFVDFLKTVRVAASGGAPTTGAAPATGAAAPH
ncbi:MAG: hypothetical protein AB1716_09395 [Planctomycetota bacterium]